MPRKQLQIVDGKRYSISARATLKMHMALKDAAAKSGRSVAQEVEFRLEQSLFASDLQSVVRAEIERAFAREAERRESEARLPNMSEADRIEWLKQ